MNLLQTYFDQLRSTKEDTHSFLLVQDHARLSRKRSFSVIQPEKHHQRPSLKFKCENDALAPPCLPIRHNSQSSLKFCPGDRAPPSAPCLPKRQNSQPSLGSSSKGLATSLPSIDKLRLEAPSIPTRKKSFDDLTQLAKTTPHTVPSRNKNKLFSHIAPPIRSHSSPIFRSGSKQQRIDYFLKEVERLLLEESTSITLESRGARYYS